MDLSAQIKKAEQALAALPDVPEFASERAALANKAKSLKREIITAKPMGARYDGTKDALNRAKARRAEAQAAVEVAQQLLQVASDEVVALETELQELEIGLACSSEEPSTAPIHEILSGMVEDLRSKPNAHPAHIAAAERHVALLFEGFREATAFAENQTREATSQPPALRRHSEKGPPRQIRAASAGPRSCLVRHIGKQPRKEKITDYFLKKKVVVRAPSESPASAAAATAGAPAATTEGMHSGGFMRRDLRQGHRSPQPRLGVRAGRPRRALWASRRRGTAPHHEPWGRKHRAQLDAAWHPYEQHQPGQ